MFLQQKIFQIKKCKFTLLLNYEKQKNYFTKQTINGRHRNAYKCKRTRGLYIINSIKAASCSNFYVVLNS